MDLMHTRPDNSSNTLYIYVDVCASIQLRSLEMASKAPKTQRTHSSGECVYVCIDACERNDGRVKESEKE